MGLFGTLVAASVGGIVLDRARRNTQRQQNLPSQVPQTQTAPTVRLGTIADFANGFVEGWANGTALGEQIQNVQAGLPLQNPSIHPLAATTPLYGGNASLQAQMQAAANAEAARISQAQVAAAMEQARLAEIQRQAAAAAELQRQQHLRSLLAIFAQEEMARERRQQAAQERARREAEEAEMLRQTAAAMAAFERLARDFLAGQARKASTQERAKRQAEEQARAEEAQQYAQQQQQRTREETQHRAEQQRRQHAEQEAERTRKAAETAQRAQATAKAEATAKAAAWKDRLAQYELAWQELAATTISAGTAQSVRNLIPWPTKTLDFSATLDESQVQEWFKESHAARCKEQKCACPPRRMYMKEFLRWHPDNVGRRMQQRGLELDVETLAIVTMIAQTLNALCSA